MMILLFGELWFLILLAYLAGSGLAWALLGMLLPRHTEDTTPKARRDL